ncbi:hypothetical protein ABW19_dt0202491 [Dactylella cylindrospora]|nr:hypothetical protein ABW19_dt0202491 [Dactylella cylindrospora]
MEDDQGLEAVPEDDLVIIPRSQSSKAPGNKRAFQKRRRSRACDACRLRKTKCDAPPEGTCSSCASASLLCKFTEPESEKKKIGPARRLRMLEATVQELNEKLRIAEAKLQSTERSIDSTNSDTQPSSTESLIPPVFKRAESPSTSSTVGHSSDDRSPRPSISQPTRRFSYDSSGNEDLFVGTTSGLGFLASVQEYVERLGYDTTSLIGAWKNSEARAYPTNLPAYPEGSQINDLRVLLPEKAIGKKLLDIFHHTTARCVLIFQWPIILHKFERAYEAPIFINDQPTVTSVFCVLMAIYAYSSICSDDLEVFEPPTYNSKRGWHFFECAKKYHDLHQPMYSLADAEVLLAMALYLDVAALPSPTWMAVGSLARVCQDLGLHRKPTEGKLTAAELEHRSRMFWCAFLLDRKLSLQSGRPPILDEGEIDMTLPGEYDTSDVVDETFEDAPLGMNTFSSIAVARQLIDIARFVDPILRIHFEPGNEQQIEQRLHDIEQKLDVIEKRYPEGMLDWENSKPLDPVLLKYALMPMAVRLSMYRSFTDASLERGLRTRCFIRSVEVGKSTVHLLHRMMKYPDWERGFRLRQSELSYQHTFKISIVLLLASAIFTKPFQIATNNELSICIRALKAAESPVRPTVMQSLHLFEEIAKILKNENVPKAFESPTTESPNYGMSFNTVNYEGPSSLPTSLPNTASMPSAAFSAPTMVPTTTSHRSKPLHVPPVVPSNDIQTDSGIVPKFWPNYDTSGRASLGFSSLKVPSPSENTTWLNQVDPSYWALMENVLSNEGNLDRRQ